MECHAFCNDLHLPQKEGYEILGEALAKHENITELDLSKNFFKGTGPAGFTSVVLHLNRLFCIYIRRFQCFYSAFKQEQVECSFQPCFAYEYYFCRCLTPCDVRIAHEYDLFCQNITRWLGPPIHDGITQHAMRRTKI